MYVKDRMSTNLITIKNNESVSKAMDLMSSNDFHRLPVVDEQGRLLGLVTGTVIQSNTPNNASSLSVFELNYLLNKLTINDIMIKDVKTISPDALLEEAAVLMREKQIGCLPVMEEDKLVGIITHNDIFDAFVDLLGYHQKGTKYVINVKEDKAGILSGIADVLKEENISISNLAVYHNSRGVEVVVVTSGDDAKAADKLTAAGYNLSNVVKLG